MPILRGLVSNFLEEVGWVSKGACLFTFGRKLQETLGALDYSQAT